MDEKEDKKVPILEKEQTATPMRLGTHIDRGISQHLQKTVEGMKPEEDKKKKKTFTKNKIRLSSPYDQQIYHEGTLEKDGFRIADRDLKAFSQYDPYISAIISTRVAQVANIMNQSESKFDKGVRVVDLKPPKKEDFKNTQEFEQECNRRKQQMDSIMKFALNCGTTSQEVLDLVYSEGDRDFKHTTLQRWAQSQTRNLLTFGRMATQKMFAPDGELALFRPAPVESIKPVDPKHKVFISRDRETTEQSVIDANDYNKLPEDTKPCAYIQEIDGKQVGFFTAEDMSVKYYQDQCLIDLNGYPLSPIELATYMVFIHQQTLEYLKNQFTRGILAKSILVINTTDPSIDVNPKDLQAFKKELQNFATRTENSASIPVLSGPVTLTPVEIFKGMHDMEWLQVEQAIIRSLCSSFQIDPSEIGQGMVNETSALSRAGKDTEVTQSQERGLRILVDVLMEELNEVLYQRFSEAKDKFKLVATGIGSEDYDGFLERSQAELQTTATLNGLFSSAEVNVDSFEKGGDVPLNPLWHANVKPGLFYGEYREYYLKDKDASKRPEYQFLMDVNLNEMYQQLRGNGTQLMDQQQQLQGLTNKAQEASLIQAIQNPQSQQDPNAAQPVPQPVQKSQKLKKSEVPSLLKEWLKLHQS